MGTVSIFKVGNYYDQPQVFLLLSPSVTGMSFAAQ